MFKTEELELNGVPRLGITLDKYPEITFILGCVRLIEDGNILNLKFEYDIIEGTKPDNEIYFENEIGKFVEFYIRNNTDELIYHGGT